jgi:hypothetical protein
MPLHGICELFSTITFSQIPVKIPNRQMRLSAHGLTRIPWTTFGQNFRFKVEGVVYRCCSLLASFLSPAVARFIASDSTLSSYSIRVEDPNRVFAKVLALGMGETIEFSSDDLIILAKIATELENPELTQMVMGTFDGEITVHNVMDRITLKRALDFDISQEVTYLATNFHSLPQTVRDALDPDVLYDMFSDSSFQVLNEDSLFDFIHERAAIQSEFANLFGFVHFANLLFESVQKFIAWADLNADLIRPECWWKIGRPLLLPATDNDRFTPGRLLGFHPSEPLDGIIAHLTRLSNGNVHKLGIVTVTASSNGSEGGKIVDLEGNSYLGTADQPNSWIQYTFKTVRVRPTHYSIRSYFNGGVGFSNPKNWIIEGSTDGIEWVEIDHRENSTELNARNVTASFKIAGELEGWTMLRMRMIGRDHAGHNILRVSGIEYFGYITRIT